MHRLTQVDDKEHWMMIRVCLVTSVDKVLPSRHSAKKKKVKQREIGLENFVPERTQAAVEFFPKGSKDFTRAEGTVWSGNALSICVVTINRHLVAPFEIATHGTRLFSSLLPSTHPTPPHSLTHRLLHNTWWTEVGWPQVTQPSSRSRTIFVQKKKRGEEEVTVT